jgi:hypothetical protein
LFRLNGTNGKRVPTLGIKHLQITPARKKIMGMISRKRSRLRREKRKGSTVHNGGTGGRFLKKNMAFLPFPTGMW